MANWKDIAKPILERHIKDRDAVDLCLRYFATVKSFDALAQGSVLLPEVVNALNDFLQSFPGNTFYMKYRENLLPLMKYGYSSWARAISSSQNIEPNSREAGAFALARRQFHEVAVEICNLSGGNPQEILADLTMCEAL